MELMQLEMFVAVAEEHSFLRAAERVFRTQPAVSIGLRKLEGKVGVPLLDRSVRRSGQLTPAGERLYEYARKILGLRDEALSAVARGHDDLESALCVGLVGEDSLNRFPAFWKSFKDRHASVEIKVRLDTLTVVLGELANGRLDLVLLSGRPRCDAPAKGLVVTRLRQGAGRGWLWVVRPKLGNSPLAHAFERTLVEIGPARPVLSKPKRIHLPRLTVVR
jgi:DNA-binding transcriptional LysR family regulator